MLTYPCRHHTESSFEKLFHWQMVCFVVVWFFLPNSILSCLLMFINTTKISPSISYPEYTKE